MRHRVWVILLTCSLLIETINTIADLIYEGPVLTIVLTRCENGLKVFVCMCGPNFLNDHAFSLQILIR